MVFKIAKNKETTIALFDFRIVISAMKKPPMGEK